MALRRRMLLTLSGLLFVGAFLLATSDTHSQDFNCGSALLPRDTTSLGIDTGNVADDDFRVEEITADCAQLVLRQRFLLALTLVVAIACPVVAGRMARSANRFPGDPIV